ncbi:MAG: radical SAM protein [Desulfovibrionaceae bacterium]|nr:radical SAM protein [Desulfovibrionaceae bacterium]
MSKRSSIGVQAIARLFWRYAKHPWVAKKLVALQAEKWLLSALNLHAARGSAGKIRQLSIRITDLCNLRCVMCGQWGERGFLKDQDLRALKAREVPLERYRIVLDDLAAKGHKPLVYLWGGEPLLYDGALEVIEQATGLGLPASIATNGSRVAAVAERLVRAPLFLLQVSIDGHTAELHNRIRPSVSGSDTFAQIEQGLDAVRGHRQGLGQDLPLIASLTTISRDNHKNLADIYKKFRDKVDLFVFYLSWWIDEQAANAHEKDFERRFGFEPKLHRGWVGGWRPDDYAFLDQQLKTLRDLSSARNAPPVILIPNITGPKNLETYYTDHQSLFGFKRCISIFQAVELDSNGDMSPCRDYHDYVVGNIKDELITDLWNNEAYTKFRSSLAREGLMPVCSRCCGLMGY